MAAAEGRDSPSQASASNIPQDPNTSNIDTTSTQANSSTVDLSAFPDIQFGDVESYAKTLSGCESTTKAYKFFAEPGYLHDIKVVYNTQMAKVDGRCYRSMRKNEPPHTLELQVSIPEKRLSGKCSCAAGVGGMCHHVIALGFYMAHCKQMGLKSLPDDLTCTSMQQRWSIPRSKKIEQKEVQDVLVKKPKAGANYCKFIKSTLYSPSTRYAVFTSSEFEGLDPVPLMASIIPSIDDYSNLPSIVTKFGNAPKGSVLSYQQKLTSDYIINEYACPSFPKLPLQDAEEKINNNLSTCLDESKAATLDSLAITREVAIDIEERTVTQSANNLWHLLRKKRLTASKFGLVAKRRDNHETLVAQLTRGVRQTAAMKRGIELESRAAAIYASRAKNDNVNLYPSGLVINPKCPWLGCSPDRKVFDIEAANQDVDPFGLLEIKVVQEGTVDFNQVNYLSFDQNSNKFYLKTNHNYYYQVQGQLALTGLTWCDFFSYINDTQFVCTRIKYDHTFFQDAKDKIDNFFFKYFIN